jgi:hypothetical protein
MLTSRTGGTDDERPSSRYRFHPVAMLGLLQGEGELTLEGWESAARQILDWPSSNGTRRLLSDRRRMAGNYPVWLEDRILSFIRERAQMLGDVQWAVVLPENSEAIEVVRHTAQASQGTRVRIRPFTDTTEAFRWLLGVYEDEQIAALLRWVDQDR